MYSRMNRFRGRTRDTMRNRDVCLRDFDMSRKSICRKIILEKHLEPRVEMSRKVREKELVSNRQ